MSPLWRFSGKRTTYLCSTFQMLTYVWITLMARRVVSVRILPHRFRYWNMWCLVVGFIWEDYDTFMIYNTDERSISLGADLENYSLISLLVHFLFFLSVNGNAISQLSAQVAIAVPSLSLHTATLETQALLHSFGYSVFAQQLKVNDKPCLHRNRQRFI